MNQVPLGTSGVRVSKLCLGTMMFGRQTNEQTARKIVDCAYDHGVNFIDTANVYHRGKSETVTGKLIRKRRDHWVLATKLGQAFDPDDLNQQGLSRRWITKSIDDSLARLGTDYIDILYFHKEDHSTGLDESVRAVGDAIKAGKIRYYGLSNFRAWRHGEVVWLAKAMGVPKPVVSQPYYNALNRMPEVEVLPVCRHHGMAVVPYSPLARGVLTGKYQPGSAPAKTSRAGRKDLRMMQTEFREESLQIAQEVAAHAESRGMTAGQYALNWVLANPIITAAIVGPRTLAQFTENLGALDHGWRAEDEAVIDRVVAAGHPSTPGYNDPAYPIEGRPVSFPG